MRGAPTPSSLEAFLSGVERRAYRMALLATRDRAESFDIVQESMLKLVEYYRGHPSHEWGPLFQRILQHNIIAWYRQQRRRKRWFWQPSLQDEDDLDAVELAAGPDNDIPEHVIECAADVAVVLKALEALPLRQQQAFMLRQWEGYDTATTASIMECSEGTVKTHYFRALQQLRKALTESATPVSANT